MDACNYENIDDKWLLSVYECSDNYYIK